MFALSIKKNTQIQITIIFIFAVIIDIIDTIDIIDIIIMISDAYKLLIKQQNLFFICLIEIV